MRENNCNSCNGQKNTLTFPGTAFQYVQVNAVQLWTTSLAHICSPIQLLFHPPIYISQMKQAYKLSRIFIFKVQISKKKMEAKQELSLTETTIWYTSFDQGPLTSSGFKTFCHLCRHCTSVLSLKHSAT